MSLGGAGNMIRDMNGSVGLSREYGNVSHDTLPYFCCRMPSAGWRTRRVSGLAGSSGENVSQRPWKRATGQPCRKTGRSAGSPADHARSGCADPVRSPAESRPYDVSIKFIRQGLLFLRKTFYLVANFDAFGKKGAFFLNAEIIDLKASINYIITCKACPKLVSGLNH